MVHYKLLKEYREKLSRVQDKSPPEGSEEEWADQIELLESSIEKANASIRYWKSILEEYISETL